MSVLVGFVCLMVWYGYLFSVRIIVDLSAFLCFVIDRKSYGLLSFVSPSLIPFPFLNIIIYLATLNVSLLCLHSFSSFFGNGHRHCHLHCPVTG